MFEWRRSRRILARAQRAFSCELAPARQIVRDLAAEVATRKGQSAIRAQAERDVTRVLGGELAPGARLAPLLCKMGRIARWEA